MLHYNFRNIFFCAIALLAFTCNSNKNSVGPHNCKTTAVVKDFTGLDGCGLLIVLDNGDKLLPAKMSNPNFKLQDGQKIRLNYTVLEDAMSICMAEKASIEITCIELVEGIPVIPKCYDIDDPMTVKWMKKIIDANKPLSIQKFQFRTDGWAYLYFYDAKQVLYDCQGTLICEHEGRRLNQCRKKNLPGAKGRVIYRNGNSR